MGASVGTGAILILLALVAPGAVALDAPDVEAPTAPPAPTPPDPSHPLDLDRVLYDVLNLANDVAHAPCASAYLVPSDSALELQPVVGEQATGLRANGGAGDLGTNAAVMTYPQGCVNWARERALGGTPQELDSLFDLVLP